MPKTGLTISLACGCRRDWQKIFPGGRKVGVEMGFPVPKSRARSSEWNRSAASCDRQHFPDRCQACDNSGRDFQGRDAACLSTLLCHALVGVRRGYSDRSGLDGACGHSNDSNLLARDAKTGLGGEKSVRPARDRSAGSARPIKGGSRRGSGGRLVLPELIKATSRCKQPTAGSLWLQK